MRASLFNRYNRIEDAMLRAAMPRVSQLDPPQPRWAQVVAVRQEREAVVLTAKMADWAKKEN